MQLTTRHIQSLYDFVEQHNVEYYDLQTELVDHLANDIEAIWKNEPHLTFEQARYKATIKFGLKGFSNFVQQREKEMKKENWRLFKQFFIEYFKMPKVLMTVFLIALVYLAFQLVPNKTILVYASFLVLVLGALIRAAYFNIKYKVRRKKTSKRWLFEDIITNRPVLFITIMIFVQPNYAEVFQGNFTMQWSIMMQLLSSIGIVLISMIFYISLWIVPPKFEATIEKYKTV